MLPTRTHLVLCLALAVLPACSLSKVAARHVQHDARHHGLQERRTVLGTRQVHFWMGGTGPPLVLVHGFGGDGLTTWARQIDSLSRTHTLIIPDLLWFGDSSAVGLEPTLDLQVRTVVDLLDQLQITRFDIAGISYGGFVALLLSQRHADRVDHVVIVDSPGPVFELTDQQAMNQRLGVDDPADIFVPQTPQDVGRLLTLVRPHGPAIPRFVLRDIQRAYFLRDQDQHRALLANLVSLHDVFPPESLRVPQHALVIWGSEDPVFPLSKGRQLADALHAELVVIDGAAHGPNYQDPAEFNQALLAFLDGEHE